MFGPCQKWSVKICPKFGWEVVSSANQDLADILGRTDLDFDISIFWDLEIWQSGSGFGQAWAGLVWQGLDV